MAIEIKELIVKFTVQKEHDNNSGARQLQAMNHQIKQYIEECVEKKLSELERRTER